MYAFDTCVLIDLLRGKLPYFYERLRNTDSRLFKIPAIVEGEFRVGAEKSPQQADSNFILDEFLLPFEIIPFDSRCAHTYAKLRAYLERKGQIIGPNDLLIAATCVTNDLTLITHNVREFKRVPGLRLEAWTEMDPEGNFYPPGKTV